MNSFKKDSIHERAKDHVLDDSKLAYVTGGTNNDKKRINCPCCGATIETTMEQIIASQSLFCPQCGLRLDIEPIKNNH